jgi:hypothetical protein
VIETLIEMSPEIGELAKALPKAQKAIAKVSRDATNPHFTSKYASFTEVADAVVPAMNDHGISVLQPVTSGTGAVQVTTMLLHESAQWLRFTHVVPVARGDAQGIGSALTYAKRQALQSLFTVAPQGEDDDGEGAVGRGPGRPPLPPAAPPPKPARAERMGRLEKTISDVKTLRDIDRAWDLAKDLRAELAEHEPAEAARLDSLYAGRRASMVAEAG